MVFKKKEKKQKKKTIPKKEILKAIKDKEYLDLGEPFGESARRYLAYQLMKMIDNQEITGTVITPEGVFLALTSSEVRNIVKFINAKGICNLDEVATENKWDPKTVKLIANNRINLLHRKDNKIITRKTALDLLAEKLNQNVTVDLNKVAEEMQLKKNIILELFDTLLEEKRIEGYLIKSSNKFLPLDLLEESIKEQIENYEMNNVVEVKFSEIAEEFGITEEHVYNILLSLYNKGDIDVQLNLGLRTCVIKENIKPETWKERIPEEEKKLDIEDLTQKK